MKYLIFLASLMAVTVTLRAAQSNLIDSLQNELKKNPSPQREIDLLNQISHAYTQLSLDRADFFAKDALEKASAIGYQKGIAAAYNNMGIYNSIQGKYTIGLDYFIKSLRIREAENDVPAVAKTLNNITRVFIYQKDFDKAIEYANKSLEALQKLDDPTALASTHIVQGTLYMAKKDYTRAHELFNEALAVYRKSGTQSQQATALLQICTAYEQEGKPDEALAYATQASSFLNERDDLFTFIELSQSLGMIYTQLRDQQNAKKHLKNAMVLSDANQDSNGQLTSRHKLSEMYKAFGKYDSSLYYLEEYIRLNTEIFDREKASQIATLEKIYQTEKKDQLLANHEQLIQSQHRIIIVVSVLLVVIAMLGVFLFRYSSQKKKANAKLLNANRDISEKNEEIMAQSEELKEANEEIRSINDNLEREVAQRTEKIQLQNQMLIEYAYFNAHNVRGPVARILGLAMLMEKEQSVETIQDYSRRVNICALELDSVIKEINSKLGNA